MTKRLLQLEFLAFYILIPLTIAVVMPPGWMFPMLFAFTALGALLLHLTPGFHWRELITGFSRIHWPFVVVFSVVTLAVAMAVILTLRPEAFLMLVRQRPDILLMIVVLYPVLSALPQELIFRPLFFRRYGGLMPRHPGAILINAGVFSFAHLMYWNWPAVVMTFAGGLAFAYAYETHGSFPAAVLMHAIAGCILFALGLGVFFYTGMIQRPF